MPLASFFREQLGAIEAFLVSPNQVVRRVLVDGEMRPILLKMLAGRDAEDDQLGNEPDRRQPAASSIARGRERLELEADAASRGLRDLIAGFRQKGEYKRVMVLELLFVKGWPNWQVAEFLGLTEQQVANYRFAAVRKLTEAVKAAGLPGDVFPELQDAPP